MNRGANSARFTMRTRVLTIVAAMVLVGSVPFHYASVPVAMLLALVLALIAAVSAFFDARSTSAR